MSKSKIHILYAENKKPLRGDILRKMYELVPIGLREDIDKYKRWQDRQASLMGKLLLANWAKLNLNNKDILDKIFIDEKGRPGFHSEIDFNISHSEGIAICAINQEGRIGADIERVSPIEMEDFKRHFSAGETNLINNGSRTLKTFFDIWTRKEAILKAVGDGFPSQLDRLDTSIIPVPWKGGLWYTESVSIDTEYSCHVATLTKAASLQVAQFIFE